MTVNRLVGALATVALAAALFLTQAGTAFAGAQLGEWLSGYPTVDNTTTVSNESGTDELDKLWNEETNQYHCGDYHKIVTPNGVMSAYPYGTTDWDTWFGYAGWTSEADPGRPKETIYGVSYDVPGGSLEIRFANSATTQSFNKIRFDCASIYPGQQTQTITVQSPTEIADTTATIHASVAFLRGSEVCIWRAFVEYGSDPGSYARIASAGLGQQVNSNQLELPPVRLTGLSPGTTYHYRIVFDQGFCPLQVL